MDEEYQAHAWHEVGLQRSLIMKCELRLLIQDCALGRGDLGLATAQAMSLQKPSTKASSLPSLAGLGGTNTAHGALSSQQGLLNSCL